jgi:hypothetical protein
MLPFNTTAWKCPSADSAGVDFCEQNKKKDYRLPNTCQIGACTDSNLGNSNIRIMFLLWVIQNHYIPKQEKTHTNTSKTPVSTLKELGE